MHDTKEFCCGDATLDQWIKQYALENHRSGAARVFVSTTTGDRVAGYYSLSSSSASKLDLPTRTGRSQPDPVPMALLGRLAVDQDSKGGGLGAGLLRDAMTRTLIAADTLGIRAMIVHAASPEAVKFYEKFGFEPSPTDEMHLSIMLKDVKKIVQT
jgi:GNAT superfamily N-acetyltransferase